MYRISIINLNKMIKFRKLIKIKYVLPRYYTKENPSDDTSRKISDNIKEIYNMSTNNIAIKYDAFKVYTKRNYQDFNRFDTFEKIFTIWFCGFILTFIIVLIQMIKKNNIVWQDKIDTTFDLLFCSLGALGISVFWPLYYISCGLHFFKK